MLESFRRRVSPGAVVFLSGAGLSAESGIPTFRGKEGYWTVGSRDYHPQELATAEAFSRMPEEVWAWYLYRRGVCRQAAPNAGHEALVRFEELLGDRFLQVTQNVDGLQVRAGGRRERIYEIHGSINSMRCWQECNPGFEPISEEIGPFTKGQKPGAEDWALLRCSHCGGLARPHILWFDECYDEEHYRFQSSRDAARNCEILVSVGTSGNTNLPLQMGDLAAARGALLVDINPRGQSLFRSGPAQRRAVAARKGLDRPSETTGRSERLNSL